MIQLPETAQEVFNTVVRGLASQGWQRSEVDENGDGSTCVYRSPTGLRCAAGWLIPDDEYQSRWDEEAISWFSLERSGLVPSEHVMLITNLQQAHDSADSPEAMRTMFLRYTYAARNELTWPNDVPKEGEL